MSRDLIRDLPCKTALLSVILILLLTACASNPNQPLVTLPAAQTPLLETILDIDARQLVPFNATGEYYRVTAAPLNRIYLRLRAPWPTDFKLSIDGSALPVVTDTAAHPELESSGYFRVDNPEAVDATDPLFFWRILVVLPQNTRAMTHRMTLAVQDISQNQNLTGTAKESVPLQISLLPFDATLPQRKSSEIFFSGDNQKHPRSALIARDIIVAGWLAGPFDRGGNSDGSTEDVHFSIWLDKDFIARNYQGVHTLDSAIIPGRPYTDFDNIFHPAQQILITNGAQPTANTFLIPGRDNLNIEQNAWHISKRGTPPPGWFMDTTTGHSDDAYTQVLILPDGWPSGQPFNEGDYVEIIGVLIEDSAHLHFANNTPQDLTDWRHKCWDQVSKGNGGWLELHPFDAIQKLPAPAVRKHLQFVQVCNIRNEPSPLPSEINYYLTPMQETPPTPKSVLRYEEAIDTRFTDMNTVTKHIVDFLPCEPTKLHVNVGVGSGGHFMATYNLWWEEASQPRPPLPAECSASPTPTPSPIEPPEDLPVCNKKPYLPQCTPVKDEMD